MRPQTQTMPKQYYTKTTKTIFKRLPALLLTTVLAVTAAVCQPRLVADQTFELDGNRTFSYALAEGDSVFLYAGELTGKALKFLEFIQYPDNILLRTAQSDTLMRRALLIPKTGVYQLRFAESGLRKKWCRFTLHRKPANVEMARFDTRVSWDLQQFPQFKVVKKSVVAGKRTEMLSLGGQVTVAASKLYFKKPVNVYQFTLPPNTVRWAYRVAVGQALQEARQKDTDRMKSLLQSGAAKLLPIQPETALAAFALGMAVDMTVSTSGEDVEYALTDWENWLKFAEGQPYRSFIHQSAVSVDAQRRYAPLEGQYCFSLRSDNWVDDITVQIDIEAVTEVPVFETESYLEPVR